MLFSKDFSLPIKFKNFKKNVIRHFKCDSHKQSSESFHATQKREKEQYDIGKQCGLNCASASYTCLYFAESKTSYEHHIAGV